MHKTMKIILLKPVEKLGRVGEIREVAQGFARNYLIPRGLADVATPELVAQMTRRQERNQREAVVDLERAESLAARLDGQEITVRAKASPQGRLYAAVPPSKIAAALQGRGFSVAKDQIATSHIKEAGEHAVAVTLAHGLEAKITVIVEVKQAE